MNQLDLLRVIFHCCGYRTFLELGVRDGLTLSEISKSATYAVGVDLNDQRKDQSTSLFLGLTDDFFAFNRRKFDLIFIDASRDFGAVATDLQNSLNHLHPFGTVVVNNTDPKEAALLNSEMCGDAYKINTLLANPDLMWCVLPSNEAGVTLVRRRSAMRHLYFQEI